MGKWLVESFCPTPAAGIEPELDLNGAIAHQECIGWREQNGVLYVLAVEGDEDRYKSFVKPPPELALRASALCPLA